MLKKGIHTFNKVDKGKVSNLNIIQLKTQYSTKGFEKGYQQVWCNIPMIEDEEVVPEFIMKTNEKQDLKYIQKLKKLKVKLKVSITISNSIFLLLEYSCTD
jgi:formiminotetrahydrofolate cyclodeaminase